SEKDDAVHGFLRCSGCGLLQGEDGLAVEAPRDQILRDLGDLRPRALEAHVRRELAQDDELGETAQAHRRRLAQQLGEEIESVERGAARDEELASVERDL